MTILSPFLSFSLSLLLSLTPILFLPLSPLQVTPGGKAEKAGLISGDYITAINNTNVKGLKHLDAKQLVIKATTTLELSW